MSKKIKHKKSNKKFKFGNTENKDEYIKNGIINYLDNKTIINTIYELRNNYINTYFNANLYISSSLFTDYDIFLYNKIVITNNNYTQIINDFFKTYNNTLFNSFNLKIYTLGFFINDEKLKLKINKDDINIISYKYKDIEYITFEPKSDNLKQSSICFSLLKDNNNLFNICTDPINKIKNNIDTVNKNFDSYFKDKCSNYNDNFKDYYIQSFYTNLIYNTTFNTIDNINILDLINNCNYFSNCDFYTQCSFNVLLNIHYHLDLTLDDINYICCIIEYISKLQNILKNENENNLDILQISKYIYRIEYSFNKLDSNIYENFNKLSKYNNYNILDFIEDKNNIDEIRDHNIYTQKNCDKYIEDINKIFQKKNYCKQQQ